MSLGFGGSRSKSSVRQFGFTQLEEMLQGINLDIVRQQFDTILQQAQFQYNQMQLLGPEIARIQQQQRIEDAAFTDEDRIRRVQDQATRQDRLFAAQDEILQGQLDLYRQGPGATPEQRDLINQATEAQIARGESDITEFTDRLLGQITQELAPSLGLRSTDTPIQDRAFRVGAEAARQQGQLVSGLRGQQAEAELNFPLAARANQAALGQFQQQLAQSASDFQQQLEQQAQANRLNFFGQTGQLGLGLIGATQPAIGLQEAFRPQLNQVSRGESIGGSGSYNAGSGGGG